VALARDAPVDDGDGAALAVALAQEVRPDLELDQDHERGIDARAGSAATTHDRSAGKRTHRCPGIELARDLEAGVGRAESTTSNSGWRSARAR
jgi:hypothetical protein